MGWPRLTTNHKLGALAVALGALAVFADVVPGHVVELDLRELLTDAARGEDHVEPARLAAWIVEGRGDFRLVDVRDPRAYAEYHIPTAENVPLATMLDGALSRTDSVVLYGEGGVHAAQAWLALRGRGHHRVRTLRGDLEAWKDEVLFPRPPAGAGAEERARFEQAAEVAKFFGGRARAAAEAGQQPPSLAPLAAPSLPAVAPPTLPSGARSGPRRQRQGC